MDSFAEPVIGPRVRADPLARNDGQERANKNPAGFDLRGFAFHLITTAS